MNPSVPPLILPKVSVPATYSGPDARAENAKVLVEKSSDGAAGESCAAGREVILHRLSDTGFAFAIFK